MAWDLILMLLRSPSLTGKFTFRRAAATYPEILPLYVRPDMSVTQEDFDEELDTLYSPSKWVKRFSPDTICEKHLEFVRKRSEQALKTIQCTLNYSYGDLPREKIDIFGIDLEDGAPIFVFIHGGYWQEEDFTRETYAFIATNMHKHGIKTILVGYELCPKISLSDIVEEIEKAIKKCIEYAKEKKATSLYLSGFSAGAHLLACLLQEFFLGLPEEDKKLVKFIFLLSGIYDLVELTKTSVNLPLKLDEKSAIDLSPLRQPMGNFDGKIYVIVAENDSPKFKEQAEQMNDKLIGARLWSRFVLVEDTDHFSLVEWLTSEHYKISRLILDTILQRNIRR